MSLNCEGSLVYDRLYIGGEWVRPARPAVLEVENPATALPLGEVAQGGPDDVDSAVRAARSALPHWRATSVEERADLLRRVRDDLQSNTPALARLVSQELGSPLKFSEAVQIGLPVRVLSSMSNGSIHVPGPETIGHSLVFREPVGVVGAITPWNYPLHQAVAKVAPALLAGCTVVLKPPELTPMIAFELAAAFERAGAPPGVFNLVSGPGRTVGSAIAAHPDVAMVSFTGSTQVGRLVAGLAAQAPKRVSLELGGKSATIVLEGADLPRAVRAGLRSAVMNGGQTCSALSRLLLPRSLMDEAIAHLQEAASAYVPGDPLDPGVRLGPLASAAQRASVVRHVHEAIAAGVPALTDAAPLLAAGHFVSPVIFLGVDPSSPLAQEEIFGPVLSVIPFDSEDQAVDIANNSRFGLAGAVWADSDERALRVARRIETGSVEINGGPFNHRAPFGGVKESGYGRELGQFGLEEFLAPQSIQFPVTSHALG